MTRDDLKTEVRSHWEKETCGTRYSTEVDRSRYFRELADARYALEPYIAEIADFPRGKGKRVLEIGVGAGADFSRWCRYAEHVSGIDLTESAIELTRERLELEGVAESRFDLQRMDCENLTFASGSFDIVYSYGVLHHSPDTPRAFAEVLRVLKPGGEFRGMVYHLHSWTTALLYVQHALLKGRLTKSPREIVFDHLESPGTKVYTVTEMKRLLAGLGYVDIDLWTQLAPVDLLTIQPSKKYDAPLFRTAFKLYPRRLVRALGDRFGLALMVTARKPAS